VGNQIAGPACAKRIVRFHFVRNLQGFCNGSAVFPGAETGILYVNLIVCPDAGFEADLSPPAIGVFCDQRKEFLG
jgi:hypothetical protein